MPTVEATPAWQAAIEDLHAMDAMFVLLDNGQRPDMRAWPSLYDPDLRPHASNAILQLKQGGRIGLEPRSLGATVLDVDGARYIETTPDETAKLCDDLAAHIGDSHQIGRFPSASAFHRGTRKEHNWQLVDTDLIAPCGRKSDGSPYMQANDLRLDPNDYDPDHPERARTCVDIKYWRQYVDITHYAIELRDALKDIRERGLTGQSPQLEGFVEFGRRYKPKPEFETASRPALTDAPTNITPARLEGIRKHFWARNGGAISEGMRHKTCRRWGAHAGFVREWWPSLIDEVEAEARRQGLPKDKLKQLRNAYDWACSKPASPPPPDRANANWKAFLSKATVPDDAAIREVERERVGPDAPPIEAYSENEAPAAPAKAAPAKAGSAEDSAPLEYALGQSFLAPFGPRLLHGIDLGKLGMWIEFDEQGNWQRLTKGRIRARIRAFLRRECPDPGNPKVLRRWESNMLARSVHEVACDASEIDTSESFDLQRFDVAIAAGDRPAQFCDLTTGKARPMRPADRMMRRTGVHLPATFDVNAPAKTPLFDGILERAFNSDGATIRYIWRVLGYALTGSTEEHRMWYLQGPRATGKSLFIRVIKLVFGEYCKSVPARSFIRTKNEEHPTLHYNLRDKHLIVVPETPANAVWDDELLNSYVGGDDIGARRMHEDYIEFQPRAAIMIASNFKLKLADPESGLLRRIRVLPFLQEIPEKDWKTRLAEEIVEKEGPAILARIVGEARDWSAKHGKTNRSGLLEESDLIKRSTAQYFEESDPLRSFIAEHIKIDKDSKVESSEVYRKYRAWAEEEGIRHPMSLNWLARKLSGRLATEGVSSTRSKSIRYLNGMYLKSALDADAEDDERPY